jgi:oxalate decarboxylase/phosphoglucose isomerase-like protein (cupin superfamily)
MITIRNWRSVHPTIAHKSGLDWRLLSSPSKTEGDIAVDTEPEFRCLKNITYVSLAQLQPSLSYEPHEHSDHEEVYYIIRGKGSIIIENEEARFRDGDIIYIPPKSIHSITNDGEEMVEFLAFGSIIAER